MQSQTKHTLVGDCDMHSGDTAPVMINLDTAQGWFNPTTDLYLVSIKTPENGLSR